MKGLALVLLIIVLMPIVYADPQTSIIAKATVYSREHNIMITGQSCGDYPYSNFIREGVYTGYSGPQRFGMVDKFQINQVMNYAIDGIALQYRNNLTASSSCTSGIVQAGQYPVYFDNTMNGIPMHSPVVVFANYSIVPQNTSEAVFDVNSYPTLLTFYNNTGEIFIGGYPIHSSYSCSSPALCSITETGFPPAYGMSKYTSRTAYPPNLTFVLRDAVKWSYNTLTSYYYPILFNVQSGEISTSGPESLYHLKFSSSSMNLSSLNNIPAAFVYITNYEYHNLSTISELCPPAGYVNGGSIIIDENVINSGIYYIACLKMNAYHGGRNFTSAVVIKNATASTPFGSGYLSSDFYLLSPKAKFFKNIAYSPITPSTNSDFTISVDFEYPMFGRLMYKRTIVNAEQPLQNITTSYGTHHEFTIPQAELNYTNVSISYVIQGIDAPSGERVIIEYPEITILATNITPIYPSVITSISPYDDIVNKIKSGINIIIDTVNPPAIYTGIAHMSIPALCSINNGTERGTTLYSIAKKNATSPDKVFVSRFNVSEIGGLGVKEIKCRPLTGDAYYFGTNITTHNISSDPYYLKVVLPNKISCDPVMLKNTEQECKDSTKEYIDEEPYYSAWYCSQRSDCKWDGYACVNASVIPPAYTVNGTKKNPSCITQTGNISQPPSNLTLPPILANNTQITGFISEYLGMSVYTFLNFISLIVCIALSIIVAIKSHSGLATGIVFIGGLVMFTIIGWIPIWVLVVLIIITAFLIAKFSRETIFGR